MIRGSAKNTGIFLALVRMSSSTYRIFVGSTIRSKDIHTLFTHLSCLCHIRPPELCQKNVLSGRVRQDGEIVCPPISSRMSIFSKVN